jgi:uncharacterized circularly permuted ATP-grasp superfamily protein/uncharacterized alpha-E superfamily protein
MTESTAIPAQSDLAGFLTGELGGVGGAFDEVFTGLGARAHWGGLLRSLDQLGRDELHLRAENARRILREHGVGYMAAGNSKSAERAWELDVLPFVIGADEWREIEQGIVQRAHLLNRVLQDLFGVQRLVRNGFLPAPLVHANPAYLRACQAVAVPNGQYLHTYAVDLGRAPDGQWWVIADRTQAPTGMGFALENRSVISRVLPEAMNAVQPRSLDSVLHARNLALRRSALQNHDNPNIVLLTPGPRNEGYFEHAYLARLLGFTLVEGGDLTVRDRAVFIKTLDGLQRVDVILRRVSDLFCDPLELRGDSLLGVPGLVEATRAGNVAVANALGSGIVESPGIMPFLPGIARHLLGEDLRLPSIATWWCGQSLEFSYVNDNLDGLSIRPAFALAGETHQPGRMTASKRAALFDQIRQRPHEYVGQESVRLSRTPVMVGHRWESRPLVLRVFASFNGESYTVMPGGLARLVETPELATPALSVGGGSKDVWVLGDETGLQERAPVTVSAHSGRTAYSLPSRTAENFFWLGRYTERLEFLARVARCVVGRLNSDFTRAGLAQAEVLRRLLTQLGLLVAMPASGPVRDAVLAEILALLHEPGKLHGARELLQRIHLAAFSVRDRLSADTWRILNRLETDAHFRSGHLPLVHAASVLNTLVLDLSAFSGMEMENMTRGHGWTFLDFGRRVERGSNLARLLAGALRSGEEAGPLWEPVLEIADSVMTHRRRYFGEIQPRSVLKLLLDDEDNPRALGFQLARLVTHAGDLPTGPNPDGVAQIQAQLTELGKASADILPGSGANPVLAAESLDQTEAGFDSVSDLLTQVFFSHTVPRVN